MENRTVVPVVLSSDSNYVPQLYVCLASLVKHCTQAYAYRVFILHAEIEEHAEQVFINGLSRENVRIEFINVKKWIGAYALKESMEAMHLTVAAYYRLLIPKLFREYEKVIYLDADLLLFHDIAALFEAAGLEGGSCLAAAEDLYIGNNEEHQRYLTEKLGIDTTRAPFYFNSGVLVYHIPNIRKTVSVETLLKMGEVHHPYCDQDILNEVFQGRVQWLDIRWNCFPACEMDQFFILHYAGNKPWNGLARVPYAELWWEMARKTPYYEAELRKLYLSTFRSEIENEFEKILLGWMLEKLRGICKKIPVGGALRKRMIAAYAWFRKKMS